MKKRAPKKTMDEKRQIIQAVEADMKTGTKNTVACEKHGVFTSQFYEWRKELGMKTAAKRPYRKSSPVLLNLPTAEMRTPRGRILIVMCDTDEFARIFSQVTH